jgi:hypothetical protein
MAAITTVIGTAPRFAKDRATIIFIGTALNVRLLKQIPQLSSFRNVQLQHHDTCPLKVVTKALSPLPGTTGEQKRAR